MYTPKQRNDFQNFNFKTGYEVQNARRTSPPSRDLCMGMLKASLNGANTNYHKSFKSDTGVHRSHLDPRNEKTKFFSCESLNSSPERILAKAT